LGRLNSAEALVYQMFLPHSSTKTTVPATIASQHNSKRKEELCTFQITVPCEFNAITRPFTKQQTTVKCKGSNQQKLASLIENTERIANSQL
jgi:hypothetical protein